MSKKISFYFVSFLLLAFHSRAQLNVQTNFTAEYLVKKVLVNKSSSLTIENIQYLGGKQSIGFFKFPTAYNKIIPRGILLTTGNVYNSIGPNTEGGMGTKVFTPGDIDLAGLATGPTMDAAVLEFDFIPSTDTISFKYFFASEEYPEYVNKNVNDVFAFILSSEELNFKKNLAVLYPDIPISVDNINSVKNREYFIQNNSWNYASIKEDKKKAELSLYMQYDGLTTLLHAGAKVIPGKKYHLKLAIADVGDRLYDSGIFLEAESFSDKEIVKQPEEKNLKQLIDANFKNELKEITDSTISVNINIHFDVDSFTIKDRESYDKLDKVFTILSSDSTMTVIIQGHADSTGIAERNLPLSYNRAKTVSEYLASKGISQKRMTYYGLGTTKPISKTDLALNRRVEFIFKPKKLNKG